MITNNTEYKESRLTSFNSINKFNPWPHKYQTTLDIPEYIKLITKNQKIFKILLEGL